MCATLPISVDMKCPRWAHLQTKKWVSVYLVQENGKDREKQEVFAYEVMNDDGFITL